MIIGENEKYVSAYISPNFNHLHFWAMKHKYHYRDNEELIRMKEVYKRFEKEVEAVNATLSPHEQVKRFRLVSEEWSPQSGELSPTLKLRRAIVYEKYEHIYEEIFGHPRQNKKNNGPEKISKPLINLGINMKRDK